MWPRWAPTVVLPRAPSDLRAALSGERITVLADVVGGPAWPGLIDILERGGRYTCSGAIAGPMVTLDLRTFYLRDLTFTGSTVIDLEVMPNLIRYIEAGDPAGARRNLSATRSAPAQAAFISKAHTGNIVVGKACQMSWCPSGVQDEDHARITVYQVDLPLEHPYWLSGGRLKFEVLDATLVKVDTDAAIIGWGEGTPWGHTYVPAHGPGIRAGIETMAPFILGLDPRRVLDVERAMDLALPGHLYAKAPIDMACWDIAGQAAGLPIADLMGGGSRTPRPIASSVGAKSVEDTRDVMDRYRARGYVAHSVKIGGDVARDIARIRDVETHTPDGEIILYDVNRGWSRSQALQVMRATEDLCVTFEQPCETLDDIAAIAGRHVRLCLSMKPSSRCRTPHASPATA
jgi:hypothetical protein